jgi:hypothetical protein
MHTTDIVERLRTEAIELRSLDLNDDADLIDEAANEIEALRKTIDASPLSHL